MSSSAEIQTFIKALFKQTKDLSSLTQRIIRERFAVHKGIDVTELQATEREILKETVVRCVQQEQEERKKKKEVESDDDDEVNDETGDSDGNSSHDNGNSSSAEGSEYSPVKPKARKRKVVDSDSSEQDSTNSTPCKPKKKRQRSSPGSKNITKDSTAPKKPSPKITKAAKRLTAEDVRNVILTPDSSSAEESDESENEVEGQISDSKLESKMYAKSQKDGNALTQSNSESDTTCKVHAKINSKRSQSKNIKSLEPKKGKKVKNVKDISSDEDDSHCESEGNNNSKDSPEKKHTKKKGKRRSKGIGEGSAEESSDSATEIKELSGDSEEEGLTKKEQKKKNDESEIERPVKTKKSQNSKTKKSKQDTKAVKKSEPESKKSAKSTDSTRSNYVIQLEKIARACGPGVMPRGINYKKMFEDCDTAKKRENKLKEILERAGMEGQPSLKKAAKIKLKREAQELDVDNIITDSGRGTRKVHSLYSSYQPSPKVVSMTPLKKTFQGLKGIVDSDSD